MVCDPLSVIKNWGIFRHFLEKDRCGLAVQSIELIEYQEETQILNASVRVLQTLLLHLLVDSIEVLQVKNGVRLAGNGGNAYFYTPKKA